MDEFLKMDIFFLVTTVSVVVMTVLMSIVLIRVIRILKNIEDISVMVEEEAHKVRDDIAEVRAKVREEGLRVKHLLEFLTVGKKRKTRSKKQVTTE